MLARNLPSGVCCEMVDGMSDQPSSNAKRSKKRGCFLAGLLLLLSVLFAIMMVRLVGKAKTTPWPEPIEGIDLSLPFSGVSSLEPTNGFFYVKALDDLQLSWPREFREHQDVAPLSPYGGTSIVAFAEANPQIQQLVHQAANTAFWRRQGPFDIDMKTPGTMSAINQAKFQRWLLAEQARRGDWAAFEQIAADQLALADGLNGSVLMDQLVSMAIQAIIVEELLGIVSATNVPAATLASLQQELADHEPRPEDLVKTLRFEHHMIEKSFEAETEFFQSWPPEDGLQALSLLCRSPRSATKQKLELMSSLFVAEAGQHQLQYEPASYWIENMSQDGVWAHIGEDPVARQFVEMLGGAYVKVIRDHGKARARMRGAQLVLAIERFKQEHGQTPRSIQELVPRYINSLPLDPLAITEKPLRAERIEDSWRIYSVGKNQIDDGGNIPSDTYTTIWNQNEDVIIYPTRHMQSTKQSAAE